MSSSSKSGTYSSTSAKKHTPSKMTIDPAKFDITRFNVVPLKMETQKIKDAKQFITFVNYNFGGSSDPVNGQVVFTSGVVKMLTYGIPSVKFAKSAHERCRIRIPYDSTNPTLVRLFECFEEIDKYMIANKKEILGDLAKFADKYDYSPIVREPSDVDTVSLTTVDEPAKPKKEKPKSFTMDIETERETDRILTRVYRREGTTPALQNVETIEQFAELLNWNSLSQHILHLFKVWFSKAPDKNKRLQFGCKIRVKQTEIIEVGSSTGPSKNIFADYAFGGGHESEEEEEAAPAPRKESPKKASPKKASPLKSEKVTVEKSTIEKDLEEDEEEENDSSSDSEPEPEVKKSPASSKSAAKPAPPASESESEESDKESESESESEEEKPAPKPSGKGAKAAPVKETAPASKKGKKAPVEESESSESDDESDSDSEEEPEPPKKSGKAAAAEPVKKGKGKPAKKEESESEESESEEEEKPAPKKGGKSAKSGK